MVKLLAIVPARGGSKRLPGKNIRPLGGKPLIQWTLEAVVDEAHTVILTSDSDDILKVGGSIEGVTPLKRSAALSGDKSTVLETVINLVASQEYNDYDVVGLFLPTAPFRGQVDVMDAMALLEEDPSLDGVISTTDYEFPPTLGLVVDPDGFVHCSDQSLPFITGNTRSQDHSSVIRPNGAIYLRRMESFIRDRNFFKGRVANYHMPIEDSVDIDTLLDFKIAELILNG
tara:strand:+ start:62733 stop:63419 length:687 start_codon:yes stop_codon:yes gene_type:complete